MVVYFVIGLAGAAGAFLRYEMGIFFNQYAFGTFPLATFTANMLGCFALGWLTARLTKAKTLHPYFKLGIGTGLIGSFTTFSTFSVETVALLKDSHLFIAGLYAALSITGGLAFSFLGFRPDKYFFHTK